MALYRRGNTWWVRITAPSGKRIRKSTQTSSKRLAQEYHDRFKAELWRSEKLGDQPDRSWDEAADMWVNETTHKADHQKDVAKLKWLKQHLGGNPLDAISRDVLCAVAEIKRKEASAATANRYMALCRAILRRAAHVWGWLDSVPRVPIYRESRRRVRWLTRKEAIRLLKQLPEHQREIALFALVTGLRKSNVLGLEWSQVNLTRKQAWIHPDQAKARKAIAVPLNDVAVNVIQRQTGRHDTFVFTYNGKPIKQVNTKAWQSALRRAEIEDFRWHDLRHCWASWHAQAGTPAHVLQELGGWSCSEMVQRYAHLNVEHLSLYVDNVLDGHNLDTLRNGKAARRRLTS